MRKKREKKWEEEKQSKAALWFERYKQATAHLSAWEKQCLLLMMQPITEGIEKVLKGVRFKTLDVEESKEALLYEELVFFIPRVVGMCRKISGKMKSIFNGLKNFGDFTRN